MHAMVIVEQVKTASAEVAALMEASMERMEALFPSVSDHYLRPDQVDVPEVHFFVARLNGAVVGTGALEVHDGYGEVKSIYVEPEARQQGVASALLRQLEDLAREVGLPRLYLETGNKLNAAVRLYGRHGFDICDAFGDYEPNASSLFMEKEL